MGAITLETIHEDILEVKKELNDLKKCIHEDQLELSEQTRVNIEESRTEIKKGMFETLKL